MKSSTNILYRKILSLVFISTILIQLFIPVIIPAENKSVADPSTSISALNHLEFSENFIESVGRRLNGNKLYSSVEIKNYAMQYFSLLFCNSYADFLFNKYFNYAADEHILRGFYLSNFGLRSPPNELS